MKKSLISAVISLGVLVPVLAFAQTSTTGLLNVYVQVTNPSGVTFAPSNFTVSVSGQSPSPSSFAGSQSGTLVSLNPGSYAVTITNPSGYTASYSVGCNNTIAAGQTQTCVITLSGYGSTQYGPTPFPYPYQYQPGLTCRTDTPTVGLGQSARFTAQGGVGGTYNWYADGQNFPNVGPVLTTSFSSSGSKLVTVTNAAQTATCAATVTTAYYPVSGTPFTYPTTSYPTTVYPTTVYPTYGSGYSYPTQIPPAVSQIYYPRLPNTGFAPLSAEQLAWAVVLLVGAGVASYPYARKAFALAVR